MQRLIAFLIFAISLSSCAKEEKRVLPYANINIALSLVDPKYIEITNPSTAIKVTAYKGTQVGYEGNGIIVYNSGLDYYAYDATCTNGDHYTSLNLSDQIFAICPKCKTKFNLINGFAEGNSSLHLQRYNAIAINGYLRISN